ncbi:uncharacterized protein LOC111401644 [Olea europaea var. sylvestris]|uniref:uncharacterized protein LOC111401644 n=1 Tax=Olea europaea var. sylvestris TaxID=158386 RepID=UPI000C1CE171|nr:uncharacterized protein LOC111401644 [Olea europaea var. sylvestris]
MNYDGLSSTPIQLRYDKMCQSFASLADMAINDDHQTHEVLEWIESKKQVLKTMGSSCGSAFQIASDSGASQHNSNLGIQDPKCSKRKGAPKKLRNKSSLESASSKAKGKRWTSGQSKLGENEPIVQANDQAMNEQMPAPISYSQLLMGDSDGHVFTQQGMTPNFFQSASMSVVFNGQGNGMPYHYPNAPYQHGANM